MRPAALLLILLLAAGCTAGGSDPAPGDRSGERQPDETASAARNLRVKQLLSKQPSGRPLEGKAPWVAEEPRAILASSAAALRNTGLDVPERGKGAYLAVCWGQKNTGGYSVSVRSARIEGDRITARLALKEPPKDAIVTQALTYPYAVAWIPDLNPEGKTLHLVDQHGRKLDWQVRQPDG